MHLFLVHTIADKAVSSSICGVANNGARCPRCCSALAPPVLPHTLTGRHWRDVLTVPGKARLRNTSHLVLHTEQGAISSILYTTGKQTLTVSIGEFLKHEPFVLNLNWLLVTFWFFFKSIGTLEIRIRNFISPVSSAHSTPMQWFFYQMKAWIDVEEITRSIGEVDLSRDKQWSIFSR